MSILFFPQKIGTLEIKNRFVHSATFECMAAEEGEVTDRLVDRYRRLAAGGIGLIIPGFMYVHPRGKAAPSQTGIYSDRLIAGLARIAEAVHQSQSKLFFQLVHAGGQTNRKITGGLPMGPSALPRDPVSLAKPLSMTEKDILTAIRTFGSAARRAMEAGADGVQLHAAHGYLINQFLSPYFNRRNDAWGGTREKRFRFLAEILKTVKNAVPKKTPVLVKLNTNDYTLSQGITPDLAGYYAQRLAAMGIEGLEVSSGTLFFSPTNTCRGKAPVKAIAESFPKWVRPLIKMLVKRRADQYPFREAYHLTAAKIIKPLIGKVPLLLVGGMRRVTQMEKIVADGQADFISLSRPFVREPFLVNAIREGKTDQAACESCNQCLSAILRGRPLGCYLRSESPP